MVSLELYLRLLWNHVIVTLYERPAFHALSLARVMGILEDLLFLLLRAVEVFVLLPVLWDRVARRRHFKASTADFVPINVLKERVAFDISGSTNSCTKALAWVAVEKVHNQVLGLLGHAYG